MPWRSSPGSPGGLAGAWALGAGPAPLRRCASFPLLFAVAYVLLFATHAWAARLRPIAAVQRLLSVPGR
jgi:hypothetical protein